MLSEFLRQKNKDEGHLGACRHKILAVLKEELKEVREALAALTELESFITAAIGDKQEPGSESPSWKSMKDACIAALADGSTLTLSEVAQRVRKLGYKTKAKNPKQAVYQALNAYPRHFARVKKEGLSGTRWVKAS